MDNDRTQNPWVSKPEFDGGGIRLNVWNILFLGLAGIGAYQVIRYLGGFMEMLKMRRMSPPTHSGE